MRASHLILLFGITASAIGNCCQISSRAEQSAHDAADLARQRELVRALVGGSEVIVLARVITARGDLSSGTGTFAVERSLKGHAAGSLDLSWVGNITVSCFASDSFQDVHITPGQSYILYVHAGQILRAGATVARYGGLSYYKELQLIRERIGT